MISPLSVGHFCAAPVLFFPCLSELEGHIQGLLSFSTLLVSSLPLQVVVFHFIALYILQQPQCPLQLSAELAADLKDLCFGTH